MDIGKIARAFSGYTNRRVIDRLRTGPESVTGLTSQINSSSRSNVSQALAMLLHAEIVSRRKEGRLHYYELRTPALQEFSDYLHGVLRDARRSAPKRKLRTPSG
jgi:DNA-binding transcriptional ArsR family regulator